MPLLILPFLLLFLVLVLPFLLVVLLVLLLLLLLLSCLLLVLLLNTDAVLPPRCRCLPLSNDGGVGSNNNTNENEHSFCGKDLPTTNSTNCDMVYEEGSDVEAGGRWAVSVYNLGVTDADTNGITGGDGDADTGEDEDQYALGDENPVGEDAGAGGGEETDVSKEKSPVVTGKRAFTVVNECEQTVRVGSTGGR